MGHCALAWPCPPEGLLFPTISGTGFQEASDTASLLRSEILAAGILFSPISLIPGTAPPLRPQPNRSGLLSLPCLYGRAGDNAQASRERRLSGGVQRQLSAWERSDRGRSGPRWAGVTQVTRLHRRSKACAGAWTVGLLCGRGATSTDGNEPQTLAWGWMFQVQPSSLQEVWALHWVSTSATWTQGLYWRCCLFPLIVLLSAGVR